MQNIYLVYCHILANFQGASDSICLQWIDKFQVYLCLPQPSLHYSEVFHNLLLQVLLKKNLKIVYQIFSFNCKNSSV